MNPATYFCPCNRWGLHAPCCPPAALPKEAR